MTTLLLRGVVVLAFVSLLLLTPFDSMTNAAWHHFPGLPVPLLLRDRFNSVKALSTSKNLWTFLSVGAN